MLNAVYQCSPWLNFGLNVLLNSITLMLIAWMLLAFRK